MKSMLSFVLGLSAGVVLGESVVLTNGWRAVYVDGIEERPASEAWGEYPSHPGNASWGSVKGLKAEDHDGLWLEREEEIPEGWRGERVFVELPVPMRRVDAVVFVNGEKAGEVLRPGGALEVTDRVKWGEKNRLSLYLTHSGAGTERGVTRVNQWDNGLQQGLTDFPRLWTAGEVFVSDVFANPSVQKKRLSVEVEINSAVEAEGMVEAVIRDAEGAVVKTLREAVSLAKGVQVVKPSVAWEDPHFWDFGDGYLYTCEVTVKAGEKVVASVPAFSFGFREIWREGRELYMNGRVVHLRTCYSFGARTEKSFQFMQDIGYNVLAYSHDSNGFPQTLLENPTLLEEADKAGMGLIMGSGALMSIADDTLPESESMQETYRDFVKHFHRQTRNHPSLVASYVSQMIICNIADIVPDRIGQTVGEAGRDQVINKAREIQREFNPNILYYSHADGPNGDMSSANLYFNWTPQQEMDEWLSEWSKKGVYPWHGAEFDVPYGGSWWYGGGYSGTEYLAALFGERAYAEEPVQALSAVQEASASNGNGHGGGSKSFSMTSNWPLYWEWRKQAVQGIVKHWRGYGQNGGLLWFNLGESYGAPTNGLGQAFNTVYRVHRDPPEEYTRGVKPGWANEAYDIYRAVYQDFCGYLAGASEQADKAHAFYGGETVEKQIALVWDGKVKKAFSAKWSVSLEKQAKVQASGTIERELKPGEIAFVPFSFELPKVAEKTRGTIQVEFSDGTRDAFAFEVYPPKGAVKAPGEARVALVDPAGETAAMLDALGVAYVKVATPAERGDATHLVLGRNALSKENMGVSVEALKAGLKVLVLRQAPVVWQSLGYKVQDAMAREVFLRDKANPAYADVTEDMLRYWRGAPEYGVPEYKRVMEQPTQRGPAGTRRHVVAGLLLQVPEKAGFVPVVDGGYDLNFAAVLRMEAGAGALTLCTLDLEERVGVDPAATEVAQAVLTDFMGTQSFAATKRVLCDGADAKALAETLGVAQDAAGELVLVGRDGAMSWEALKAKAEAGATVLVAANTRLAKEAGFAVERKPLQRASVGEGEVFRTFSPALLRWRDVLEADVLSTGTAQGAVVSADGLFAEMNVGQGRVVFCQVELEQLSQRYVDIATPEAIAEDRKWMLGILRVLFEQLGAPTHDAADPKVGRMPHRVAYWDDSEEFIRESGVAMSGRDGFITVAGVSDALTTWEYLKTFAADGRHVVVLDNTKLAQKVGFEVGPRELLSTLDASVFGEAYAGLGVREFSQARSVRRLLKAPEGFTLLAGGLMAEGTVGESRVVFLQLHFKEWEKLAEQVERIRDSNDLSSERMRQMFARVLTNLGAESADAQVARALHVAPLNPLAPLPAAHVLGPFQAKDDSDFMLTNLFAEVGEKMAIEGDFNPNIDFPLPQGGSANWRPMLSPESSGLYDFQKLYPEASFPVTYSIVHVNRREAGKAMLRLGVDWRVLVWCNGKEVFRTGFGAHYPKFEVELDLQKGDNVLTFKVGSGRAGNKLWALLTSEPDPDAAAREVKPELDGIRLYEEKRERQDPYLYNYW